MSAHVLPRLVARPLTAWNLGLGAAFSLGLLLAARGLRSGIAPITVESEWVEFVTAAIVFLSGMGLGSMLSVAIFELLLCPYSTGLPAVRRRALAEMLAVGAALSVCTAVFGAIFGIGVLDCLILALLAALGFGLGVYASDPGSRRVRLHGYLTLIAILWVVFQIPEIVAVARAAPVAAVPIGISLSAVLAALPFTTSRRRARAGRRASDLDLAYREFDLRTGQWGRVSTAARDGSAPSNATRTSDIHWALATLHETQGFLRGGWIQGACSRALAGAALAMLGQWMAGRKLAPGADTLERLSRSLDHSEATMGSHHWLAIGFSIVCIGAPFFPASSAHRPVSRLRVARIAWLVIAIEDAAFGLALLAFLAIIAAVLAGLSPDAIYGPSWPTWFFSVLVLTALTPIARCARLWFLDTEAGNPRPLRQAIVTSLVCTTLLTSAIGAVMAWNTASTAQRWLQVSVWILAIVVGRRLLLWALHRHTRGRDLAA